MEIQLSSRRGHLFCWGASPILPADQFAPVVGFLPMVVLRSFAVAKDPRVAEQSIDVRPKLDSQGMIGAPTESD
jgi:hypothetical protein